ncbi:MAG: hypothetical protein KDA85_14755 [Planctomycetaceae bacterium]|nr:hypothetical protein [Planctomycetaceae bacterium]
MEIKEIRTLCLKHVYGGTLGEAERTLINDYAQTDEGREYLQECREMKNLLTNVADVTIKPLDHEAMVESFERTVRQAFQQTIFQPWWQTNSPPMILALMAGLQIATSGWSMFVAALLGICVLWLITDCCQRYYFAKILNRPDLYEYARASRKRSDEILRSLPGRMLVILCSGLAIAAISYSTYWGYSKFGVIVPAIVVFVTVEVVVIGLYQYRKLRKSDSEVWDWWTQEIRE